MVDVAISDMDSLAGADVASNDYIPIVDRSESTPNKNKSIYIDDLKIAVGFNNTAPGTLTSLFWDGSSWKRTTSDTLATTGTVNINLTTGSNVFTVVPSGDITLDTTSAPTLAKFTLVVHTSGTTPRTISFPNFKAQGNLVTGVVDDKYFVMEFFVSPFGWVSEISRTAAM